MRRFLTVLFFILFSGAAFGADIESLVPNAEAGRTAWEIFGIVFGAIIAGAIGLFMTQIAKGLAMGWVVKSWNLISPDVSCLRFGTAVGFYDSPVEKIGPFAVFCKTVVEGKVVVDRVPHSTLVNGRMTITNRENSDATRKK
jgi:hypothetical protein